MTKALNPNKETKKIQEETASLVGVELTSSSGNFIHIE